MRVMTIKKGRIIMKIEQTYKLGLREIGIHNKLTNYGILAFLEDIATYHSGLVGYGVNDIEKNKGAFLILDWNLEVKKRLSFNDTIKVKTYAVPEDKPSFHCYRNFEIYDENNYLIAIASSKWLFYNFEKHKIEKLDLDTLNLFNPEGDLSKTENKITKLKEPDSYERMLEYQVKRADIDVNNHVNNLVYLKIANEVLPEDVYFSEESNNLRITYKHQIRLGATVKIYYTRVENKHIVTIKNQDNSKLHAVVEMW